MKIVYIDDSIDGHHIQYLNSLVDGNNLESVAILPSNVPEIKCRQYVIKTKEPFRRTLREHLKWLDEIWGYVDYEKPDIIHFLNGDYFYRFFGIGLKKFKNYKSVFTIHNGRTGLLNQVSLVRICHRMTGVVVHSDYIKEYFNGIGIQNVIHIEYPQFNRNVKSKEESLLYFGLSEKRPVILCLGETRKEKGLDILLNALKSVNKPYQLLIAGKAVDFDEKFIRERAIEYSDNIVIKLHFLSDDEFALAIGAADIVALPYRKNFNGASGPLGECVAQNKCIIGPSHGNLNHTITYNHLGYTFASENSDSLAHVLNDALSKKFKPDDMYIKYRDSLDSVTFQHNYAQLYERCFKLD